MGPTRRSRNYYLFKAETRDGGVIMSNHVISHANTPRGSSRLLTWQKAHLEGSAWESDTQTWPVAAAAAVGSSRGEMGNPGTRFAGTTRPQRLHSHWIKSSNQRPRLGQDFSTPTPALFLPAKFSDDPDSATRREMIRPRHLILFTT